MRNLLLHIAYNGSRYHGYQVQQNAVSVAGTFQPVLEKILAEKVQLKGCSRTDTGGTHRRRIRSAATWLQHCCPTFSSGKNGSSAGSESHSSSTGRSMELHRKNWRNWYRRFFLRFRSRR